MADRSAPSATSRGVPHHRPKRWRRGRSVARRYLMLNTAQATAPLAFVPGPSLARWRPVLLGLPLAGLGLLLARPELNVEWHHHPIHFWLVLVSAAASVALAFVTNAAAGRHRDARVTLV